ncbi:helix-turn-helix domain-containing protein [Mucilaginibacter ginsenosidivorax]|jgi:transcriptional regulator with XRE-family HTH domain|uniref:Helix-turn-helix transcriptional regulator n=1 Tax=Mucilaginibacter ginsenosidivorax TaxID=862126 RepID=A0A5B8VXN4_9SPHI|nr:helix-turn-helix transcriptional regulator [Mucilaginibacter ginsenosidivorax]QEC75385.1 helix-turn-helix transcriptional regulator [Mucilaginibacter ginsenosidivorax]
MSALVNHSVKTIAENIRNTRIRLAYSQEYLAAKLNVSQNTYSKIELGYVKLTLERFFKICRVLEIDPAEVINADGVAA